MKPSNETLQKKRMKKDPKIILSEKELKRLIKKAVNSELRKRIPGAVASEIYDREQRILKYKQTPEYKEREYQASLKRIEGYFPTTKSEGESS